MNSTSLQNQDSAQNQAVLNSPQQQQLVQTTNLNLINQGHNPYYNSQLNPQYNSISNPYFQNNMPIQPSFRDQYQGVFNGLHAIVNLGYAGVGLTSFGQTFIKLLLSFFKFLSKKSNQFFVFYIYQGIWKRIASIFNVNNNRIIFQNLIQAVVQDNLPLKNSSPKSQLQKIMIFLRVLIFLGISFLYIMQKFIQKKIQKQEQQKIEEAQNEEKSLLCAYEEIDQREFDINMDVQSAHTLNEREESESQKELFEQALNEQIQQENLNYKKLRSEDFWKRNDLFPQNHQLQQSLNIEADNEILNLSQNDNKSISKRVSSCQDLPANQILQGTKPQSENTMRNENKTLENNGNQASLNFDNEQKASNTCPNISQKPWLVQKQKIF